MPGPVNYNVLINGWYHYYGECPCVPMLNDKIITQDQMMNMYQLGTH